MENNNLEIPIVEKTQAFDVKGYEGYKCKIAKVERKEVIDFYPNGSYDAKSEVKKEIIEIETEPLKELDNNERPTDKDFEYIDAEGETKKLTVTGRFNLQKDKDGKAVISKHIKSRLWAFMRKKGVIKVSDLKDKFVTLTLVPSSIEGDDRKFLRIVD